MSRTCCPDQRCKPPLGTAPGRKESGTRRHLSGHRSGQVIPGTAPGRKESGTRRHLSGHRSGQVIPGTAPGRNESGTRRHLSGQVRGQVLRSGQRSRVRGQVRVQLMFNTRVRFGGAPDLVHPRENCYFTRNNSAYVTEPVSTLRCSIRSTLTSSASGVMANECTMWG